MYIFEFDNDKSLSNLEKHGIDFLEAQDLWTDPDVLEIQDKSDDEMRALAIGRINGKHWSAIITYRGENIRITSIRRSRKTEVELYES